MTTTDSTSGSLSDTSLSNSTFNGSLNNAAQIAAEAALDLPDSALQPMLDEYAARRELMVELLNEVPGIVR